MRYSSRRGELHKLRASSGPGETKDEILKQERELHKLRASSGPGETMRYSSRRGSSANSW
jgi:hypothetical protein